MRTHPGRLIAALILVFGVALASTTRAAGPGEACGAGISCNPPLLCQTAAGQCNATNAKGTCEKAPAFCQKIYRQVCGCNGKTYPNDCERQRAKVQVDYVGACKKASG